MIPMRAFDVLCNLKNWTSWDYKAYKLQENEAYACKKALENYVWHDVKTEGLPKEDGWYTLKCFHNSIYYTAYYMDDNKRKVIFKEDVIAWRKIIDEEE